MKKETLYSRLQPVLTPFSYPYSLLMRARRRHYETGGSVRYRPNAPCVSVGNICWGGTGKTPFVEWLLQWARHAQVSTAVLSRGYGGKPGPEPLKVLKDTSPVLCGDEPLLLAKTYPEAHVVVCPQRSHGAAYAEKMYSPSLFVLDDGMQHLAVQRDVDIVLLRPADMRRGVWNRVIPGGTWRESKEALHAASVFAMKISPEEFLRQRPLIEKRLAAYDRPFFSFYLDGKGIWDLRDPFLFECKPERAIEPAVYFDKPYALLTGIGDPEQAAASAASFLGRPPEQHFVFPDHHPFTVQDMQSCLQGGRPLVCTSKDATKLLPYINLQGSCPIWVMHVAVEFGPMLFSDIPFPQWWQDWWNSCNPSAPHPHG